MVTAGLASSKSCLQVGSGCPAAFVNTVHQHLDSHIPGLHSHYDRGLSSCDTDSSQILRYLSLALNKKFASSHCC